MLNILPLLTKAMITMSVFSRYLMAAAASLIKVAQTLFGTWLSANKKVVMMSGQLEPSISATGPSKKPNVKRVSSVVLALKLQWHASLLMTKVPLTLEVLMV